MHGYGKRFALIGVVLLAIVALALVVDHGGGDAADFKLDPRLMSKPVHGWLYLVSEGMACGAFKIRGRTGGGILRARRISGDRTISVLKARGACGRGIYDGTLRVGGGLLRVSGPHSARTPNLRLAFDDGQSVAWAAELLVSPHKLDLNRPGTPARMGRAG